MIARPQLRPITFECTQIIPKAPIEIASEIADTSRWGEFRGYGVLPGIESAEYEKRTSDMIGSRIRVRNTDGSEHVEEILKWVPNKELILKLQEFTPPLSYLATHFLEEWSFRTEADTTTLVTRRFQLFPSGRATRPFVWLVSLLVRRAIAASLPNCRLFVDTRDPR